jgi:hypothetical protein
MTENYIVRFVIPGIINKIPVILLIIMASIFTYYGSYLTAIFIPMGIILLSAYTGVEINLKKNVYRSYLSVVGIKRGKFKPLTSLEYICVRDAVFKIKNHYFGTYSPDDNYEVSLVYGQHLKITLFYSYDKKETIQFAKELKYKYKSRIEDFTKEKLFKK